MSCPGASTHVVRDERVRALALLAGRSLAWCDEHRGWHVERGEA